MYEFFSVQDGEYIQAIQDARAAGMIEQEKLQQEFIDRKMTIDLWNSYTNKLGQASLTVSCYDEQSQHEFYF